jgi:putative transposase
LFQEDVYLMNLARYIRLNPIRAGMVRDRGDLDRHRYSGQSVLMGKVKRAWQETE